MASYFSSLKLPNVSTSSLGSTISTRFATVRQALTSGAEKDDENDENLSHVSNVLRAYYIEKGRVFPPWLPPDPRAPPPQMASPPQPSYGSNYGNMNNNPYGGGGGGSAGRSGGLSDLFDNNSASNPTPSSASQSLRSRGVASPRPTHVSKSSISSMNSSGSSGTTATARPLPSQRAGSYQSSSAAANTFNRGGSNSSTGSSAQDRLRARLQGGSGRESPSSLPPASPGSAGYGQNSYGGGVASSGGQPYVGSSRPWDSGGSAEGFNGGYGGGGASNKRAGMLGTAGGGLPSNPRVGGPRGPR